MPTSISAISGSGRFKDWPSSAFIEHAKEKAREMIPGLYLAYADRHLLGAPRSANCWASRARRVTV